MNRHNFVRRLLELERAVKLSAPVAEIDLEAMTRDELVGLRYILAGHPEGFADSSVLSIDELRALERIGSRLYGVAPTPKPVRSYWPVR